MPQPDETFSQFLARPRHSAMLVPEHYAQEHREALRAAGFKTSWQTAQSGHLAFRALHVSLGRQGPQRVARLNAVLELIFDSPNELESFEGKIRDRLLPIVVPKKVDVEIERRSTEKEQDAKDRDKAFAAYTPLLTRLAQISGLRMIIHNAGENTVPPHPPDGRMHVHLNASPPGESGSWYRDTAFGLKIAMGKDKRPVGFGPTEGRGVVLKDTNDKSLVQILDDNWYLLIPTIGYFNPVTSALIFEQLLALIWNTMCTGKTKAPKRMTQTAFLAKAKGWHAGYTDLVDTQIKDMERDIERLLNRVAELQREILIFRGIKEGTLGATFAKQTRRRLPGELRAILANPLVDSIEFLEDALHVRTTPLTTSHEGVEYRTGIFTIRINKRGATTVWSEGPTHPDGVPHPHIAKYGGPCYGNAGTTIARAGGEARYADTVSYVLTWLTQGYTHDLASVKIHEWPIAHTEDTDATQT